MTSMPREHGLSPVKAALLLALALIGLVVFQQGIGVLVWPETKLFQSLASGAHVPWFAVVTLGLCELARLLIRDPKRQWALVITVGLLLAFGTELLQLFTTRNASAADAGRNLLGMASGIGVFMLIRRPVSQPLRAGILTFCAFSLVVGFAPAAWEAAVRAHLASIAPDLIALDSRRGLAPLAAAKHVSMVDGGELSPDLAGVPVLRVVLPEREYPGVTLREPIPDWSGYDQLAIGLHIETDEPMPLTVRLLLDSGLGPLSITRLPAGPSTLRIPLSDLFPDGQPDAHRVFELIMYTSRDKAGKTLGILFVRLETAEEP
jgi:hypothetical protein